MNLITALQTVQEASASDVTVNITATLVRNSAQPLLTMAHVSCNTQSGVAKWTTFEAPNLEAAVAKALEALCPR
jgi:hypothetical protein